MEQDTDSLVKELSALQKKIRGIDSFNGAFRTACENVSNGNYYERAFNDSLYNRESAVKIAQAVIEADKAATEKENAMERIDEIKQILDIE